MLETDNLEEFLDLSWSDNMRHKLRVTADRDDVRYLVAAQNDGKLTASVFTHKPATWPPRVVAVFRKRKLQEITEVAKSKTMQAMDLIKDEGLSAYAAAKRLGINPSAVTRALQRREDKSICHACDHIQQTPLGFPGQRGFACSLAVHTLHVTQDWGARHHLVATAMAVQADVMRQVLENADHQLLAVPHLHQPASYHDHLPAVSAVPPAPDRQAQRVALPGHAACPHDVDVSQLLRRTFAQVVGVLGHADSLS
jgi:hypothetical protein